MAKFCTGCGARLEDAVKFCGYCGANCFAPPPQPAPQTAYPPPPAPQPAPPQAYPQQPMQPQLTQKQQTLQNAPGALNRPDRPWQVTAEGDALVARWKWMDATFFAPHEVTAETRDYTFTAILSDKGTWKEVDKSEDKAAGVGMSGGKLSFGASSNTFIGKQNKKSFEFGVGQNNQTGQAGLIGFKFDTTAVKQPIRDYLTACGWKKAGLFG
jgi:hypothetical protein